MLRVFQCLLCSDALPQRLLCCCTVLAVDGGRVNRCLDSGQAGALYALAAGKDVRGGFNSVSRGKRLPS